MKKTILLILLSSLLLIDNQLYSQKINNIQLQSVSDSLNNFFKGRAFITGKISIQSGQIIKKVLNVTFNQTLAEYSIKKEDASIIYSIIDYFLKQTNSYTTCIASVSGVKIEELAIPAKAPEFKRDKSSKKLIDDNFKFITNESKISKPINGLQSRYIALWQSHGLYYEQKLLRWEWQRARLFQTVEDLYTQSYVLPYLVPMLENAGATVFLPRERDVQINEVIVDNDTPESGFETKDGNISWTNAIGKGFANFKPVLLTGENPFEAGTTLMAATTSKDSESLAIWRPEIPKTGEYAVYISYKSFPNSALKAHYTVYHSGGKTNYTVNQKVGGSTWIYLGTFQFEKGKKVNQYVSLSNFSDSHKEVVSADAIKFGGGMGNIARKPLAEGIEENRKSSSDEPIKKMKLEIDPEAEISGYPRFTEGARYWLQWAGFSDTVYSATKNANDYNDDYMSRGRWVNVLSGGSYKNPKEPGLGIPLDLSFAFHTDAGTTLNDSIIGTLGIYTRNSNGEIKFPTGEPRLTSRYLTDFIQSQIVNDVQELHEPIWQRRGLWDRSYAESRAPIVPSMLLELLSHQNLADMRYGLDPEFRFTVSRAIYKGMLKYLAFAGNTGYTVQPLPVNSFNAETQGGRVTLTWQPTEDSLESTAIAKSYIVYTRIDSSGFDNGTPVKTNEYSANIEYGKIYSYKITAVNDGGESFPSEILSVYNSASGKGKVLIVNGFTKISAPASYTTKDSLYGGFLNGSDQGVPYKRDISFIGFQYDYRRTIPWSDDDAGGFGSSYNDYSQKVIAGNSFDYPYDHGKAFASADYSFVSSSREAFEKGALKSNYQIIDLIMGKQLKTLEGRGVKGAKFYVFTNAIKDQIKKYISDGTNIIISGANIGTDIWDSFERDSLSEKFVSDNLKYTLRSNNSSNTGEVKSAPNPYGFNGVYSFYREPNEYKYNVEAPDGIEPVGENAWTIFRYKDSHISAGVAFNGKTYKSVSLGFPIESLKNQDQINNLILSITNFFEKK